MVKIALILMLLATGAFASTEEMCRDLVKAGNYSAAIEVGQELLQRNPASYHAHLCLTLAYLAMPDFRSMLAHAQKLELLAETSEQLALAYCYIADGHRLLSNEHSAIVYYNRCLQTARVARHKYPESIALRGLADIYSGFINTDLSKALKYYKMALDITKEPAEQADILNDMGICYARMGNYKEAITHFNLSLVFAQNPRHDGEIAKLRVIAPLLNLGNLFIRLNEVNLAKKVLEEALPIAEQIKNRIYELFALQRLTACYIIGGDFRKSLELYYRQYMTAKKDEFCEYYTRNHIAIMACILGKNPNLKLYFKQLARENPELVTAVEETITTPNCIRDVTDPQRVINFDWIRSPKIIDWPPSQLR